eukprot:TRINITY_DN67022_c10_g2_i1.p1 TRINITY_DN67022_c10_g2~~TRINITY_DN67022_c10_g2_i1.p1  ORF type:complete len:403 (+),score=22.71 TRINITY_DN67022_c10_g2_i1:68-1210(+)
MDTFSESDAYVHMWIEANDERIGSTVCWPPKDDTSNPIWNSARGLGINVSEAAGKKLVIEFWDKDSHKDDYIGRADVNVDDIRGDEPVSVGVLSPHGNRCFVRIQRLQAAPTKKTVFFIRHGESKWNKAQKDHNVKAMLSAKDHPLNEVGIAQANALASKIELAEGTSCSTTQQFLSTSRVYSSPLTRALETCVVALQPLFKMNAKLVNLAANAREKRNFGGKDTTGTAIGWDVLVRAREEMSNGGLVSSDRIEELFSSVQIDTFEVKNKWWNDSQESEQELQLRLDEFLAQLRYCKDESIIVVGHSHFFREVFRRCLDKQYVERDQEFTTSLQTTTLQNCAVAAVTMDFAKSPERMITEVKLILDSALKVKERRGSYSV